jgi:hypothetical protein
MKRAQRTSILKDFCEGRCAHAKSLVPALRSWNTLRCVGPKQSIILDKFKCPARGTEDTSRRDELEKAFRNLLDCLRHGNHIPGAHRRTSHSASKCSQRKAHEKQPSFAQYRHWGRSRRRCRSWDWCSNIQPMLFPKLLYSAWWQRPTSRGRRCYRFSQRCRCRSSAAFPQRGLPRSFALVRGQGCAAWACYIPEKGAPLRP